MPVSYAGTVSEHTATRNAVGLFDVSHLGKALVRGPGAAEFVNSALTNDLRRIGPGKAQYTLCCTETGGVIDDLIAYYVSDDEVFLVPNAANTAAVVAAMTDAAPQGSRSPTSTASYAVLAVQGPKSPRCCRAGPAAPTWTTWATPTPISTAPRVRVCRTGYTGEHGYELLPPWDSRRRGVRRAGRRGRRGGRRAGRPGRPRHPAHRDGLPAARPRTVAGHLAAAGALRLGDRLEEGRVLGPRRAAGREGGRSAPAAARAEGARPRRAAGRPDRARRCDAGRRDHLGNLLADTESRHRAGAHRHRRRASRTAARHGRRARPAGGVRGASSRRSCEANNVASPRLYESRA